MGDRNTPLPLKCRLCKNAEMLSKELEKGLQAAECPKCGGIWLDKNEWEVLKSRNIHEEIHFIFSEPWQKAVLQDEQKKAYEAHAEKLLGNADYGRLSEFKKWVSRHPQKSFILAYVKDQQ